MTTARAETCPTRGNAPGLRVYSLGASPRRCYEGATSSATRCNEGATKKISVSILAGEATTRFGSLPS